MKRRWLRWLRNVVGRALGYSGCRACGDSWWWAEPHTTWYRYHGDTSLGERGCFPLCEACWSTLPVGARLLYYGRLADSWPSERQADDWPLIREAVLAGR
jgi:hypothetical protein